MLAGREDRLANRSTGRNFLEALFAVVAGNAIYFLLMPHLPSAAQHSWLKEDWGLAVDFGICTAIFIAVKIFGRWG
jgi:hypothetical protein